MAAKPKPQIAMDERVVEDAEFEQALEDREIAKGKAGEARKKYETLDEVARAKVEDLGLSDGDAVRVGRFRVSQVKVEGRSVEFETAATSRLKIAAQDDEA